MRFQSHGSECELRISRYAGDVTCEHGDDGFNCRGGDVGDMGSQ